MAATAAPAALRGHRPARPATQLTAHGHHHHRHPPLPPTSSMLSYFSCSRPADRMYTTRPSLWRPVRPMRWMARVGEVLPSKHCTGRTSFSGSGRPMQPTWSWARSCGQRWRSASSCARSACLFPVQTRVMPCQQRPPSPTLTTMRSTCTAHGNNCQRAADRQAAHSPLSAPFMLHYTQCAAAAPCLPHLRDVQALLAYGGGHQRVELPAPELRQHRLLLLLLHARPARLAPAAALPDEHPAARGHDTSNAQAVQ